MNFKKKYKYQKVEMSENRNFQKFDEYNENEPAREPEAPGAKNNND